MKFADLFGKATARWIKYSEYDAMQTEDGKWYIMPTKDAVPSVYDPIEKAEEMVAEASFEGDRHKVFQAIAFDPLTSAVLGLREIQEMTDEMFKQNKDYLPQF